MAAIFSFYQKAINCFRNTLHKQAGCGQFRAMELFHAKNRKDRFSSCRLIPIRPGIFLPVGPKLILKSAPPDISPALSGFSDFFCGSVPVEADGFLRGRYYMQKKQSNKTRLNHAPDPDLAEEEESLLLELIGYSHRGVDLTLNGHRRTPLQIAHTVVHDCEDGASYMRDYSTGPGGNVKKINFTKVRKL